jgi:hypothetical protein
METYQALGNNINLASFSKPMGILHNRLETFQKIYASNQPYPHLVVDDLFDSEVLDKIVADFPKSGEHDWIIWNSEHESKSTSSGIAGLSRLTQLFFLWLNSSEFIDQLKQIVGIDELVPDPLFFGAGLHEMFQGGWLDIHADYTQHPTLPLLRRINLLIYLNREWNPHWGGGIQLQSNTNYENKVDYTPDFNRTLIFPTTSETLHGVPDRLSCPKEFSRKLISVYYWSPSSDRKEEGTPLIWASNQGWIEECQLALQMLSEVIPKDETFILVDDTTLAGEVLQNYSFVRFIERDGIYLGAPSDSTAAVSELERLRSLGLRFIVFAWPAFWWLDHYGKFQEYLRSQFPGILENERLVIFELS